MDFLKNTSVAVLPKVSVLYYVNSSDSAAHTLRLLAQHNVLSMPVLDKSLNQYIGFVDMVDIVSLIVDIYSEADIMAENFYTLLEQSERFKNTKVSEIINISARNPFIPVPETSSLYTAVELLSKHKVHRVPVIDAEGHIVNLITQSSLIAFIAENVDKLGSVVNQTVGSLLLGHKDVVTVNINARVIEAFNLMDKKSVSAVAVVDDEGKLVGNISVRDIRTIGADPRQLPQLYMGIRELLFRINMQRVDIINPAIACSAKEKYGLVVKKLAASRVHRLYVVDNHLPVGVISLSDALLPLVTIQPSEVV